MPHGETELRGRPRAEVHRLVRGARHDEGATLLVTTPFRERTFSMVVEVVRPRLWTREVQDGHRFPLS